MEAKDIKWCPQHGYPLPCHKCGMPLSQESQKEIFESGKKAGIKEVLEFKCDECSTPNFIHLVIPIKKFKECEEYVRPL